MPKVTWKFMAQRATTKQWLHRDIPFLERESLENQLSAVGPLTTSINPIVGRQIAADGRPLFEELGTLLYAVADGEIRWGGIVQSSAWDGTKWAIDASTFASYPHRIPFQGEYRGVQVDPADIMRAIWAHVQSYPDGDLGVVVTGSTGLKVGTDSDDKATATSKAYDARNAEYKATQTELARLKKIVATTRATTLKSGTDARTAASKVLSEKKRVLTVQNRNLTAKKKDLTAANTALTAANEAVVRANQLIANAKNDIARAQSAYDTAKAAVTQTGTVIKQQQAAVDAQSKVVDAAQAVKDKAQDVKQAAADQASADGGAYKILWWDTPNCGQEIDDLASETPFDWTERHYFDAAGEVHHEIQVHYPRAGRFRSDLRFATGENITEIVQAQSDGDTFANEVFGVGAGEGSGALRRSTAVRNGRLRTVAVVSAKNISRKDSLDARIRKELTARLNTLTFPKITVKHTRQTPIGSWDLGDDILVQADIPWLGRQSIRHRIVAWNQDDDTHATLTLERSDSILYGG
jgi:hypothetical protein